MAQSNAPHVWNFGAGPSVLPRSVLERAQAEMLNYAGTGMSILEISHRTKVFQELQDRLESNVRRLMNVPDNYKVLFMQGGGSLQFSAIVYNLMAAYHARHPNSNSEDVTPVADYLITGSWSEKAAKEASDLGMRVNIVADGRQSLSDGKYRRVPPRDTWQLSGPNAAYFYYCANETVHGIEVDEPPTDLPSSVPIVCDMSSNIMSRAVDVSRYGVIYAGAQKNIGASGLTVIIIRDDLLVRAPIPASNTGFPAPHTIPLMLDWALAAKHGSLYNTPPMFSTYITALTTDYILEQGGVDKMEEQAIKKSRIIYELIDASQGFYQGTVDADRSRMNITFRLANDELETAFLKEADAAHMVQLKGHRSVGGIRASLYNSLPFEAVEALASFMKAFQQKHQHV
ncbi:phosphoserine aminotransferase [Syncephalis plumigaleata]|nr:phosphoserine aminotransferase [Syncephalis plumigaleata]